MKLIIPPPVQVGILAFSMWQIDKHLPDFSFSLPFQKTLSITLGLIAIAVTLIAAWKMFSSKTTVNPIKPDNATTLVSDGIFSISRNPIYVADFIFLLAWLVWLGNPANVLPLVIFPLYMTAFQIKPEEEALLTIFGDEYEAYCKKVNRWL